MKISLYIIVLIACGCFDRTHNVTSWVWTKYFCTWCAHFASALFMISYLVFFHLCYCYVITLFFSSNLEKISACNFFQRPLVTRACRARAILLVFEKIYSPNCTRNHVITYTNHLTVRFNVLSSEKASSEKYQSIIK